MWVITMEKECDVMCYLQLQIDDETKEDNHYESSLISYYMYLHFVVWDKIESI